MNYWLMLVGACVIVLALREVYRDLFHPTASGSLSDIVAKFTFNAFRRVPRFLSDAAPLSIILVIFIWAMAVAIGFALVYWAVPADYFKVQAGPPAGFAAMLYFSLEVITTLGLGDYAALPTWLRLVATMEALIGFAVLTASVSSIVLIHQSLARLRTLARKLSNARRAQEEFALSFSSNSESILAEFSAEVVRTRVDLVHFPLVYYFYSEHEHSSLPEALPTALELARKGLAVSEPESRRSAALLLLALRDLADLLRSRFTPGAEGDCETVFRAYAEHHSPVQ